MEGGGTERRKLQQRALAFLLLHGLALCIREGGYSSERKRESGGHCKGGPYLLLNYEGIEGRGKKEDTVGKKDKRSVHSLFVDERTMQALGRKGDVTPFPSSAGREKK